MPRPKLNNKRFHFHGPAQLHSRAQALAQGRGVGASVSDVLREALDIGLTTLESGAHLAHRSPIAPCAAFDEGALDSAAQTVEALVQLGEVLPNLDLDVITALAEVDAEVLQALARLDHELIDKLGDIDPDSLTQLALIDLDAIQLLEELLNDTDERR